MHTRLAPLSPDMKVLLQATAASGRHTDSAGLRTQRSAGMAPPPLVSPATGSDIASNTHFIHADDSTGFFRDVSGRCLFLRGINLASSAKTPIGQPGHQLDGFWEGAESGDISFVNRVLDLDLDPADEHSADQHLRRLKSWGFNTLRYVTTWESLEHKGPGQYDQDYIDYTIRMLRKCKEHGFLIYMDPHQDLWSRFSGGSGAPYWTLIACGLNPRNFTVTNAAVIHSEWPEPGNPDPENFPDMIWASNYTRLAVMTLMTLFFAGKHFAPLCQIDGMNIQDYLQQHYLNAYKKLAEAIRDADDLNDVCVIGWDSINEPNHGMLGLENITVQPDSNLAKIGPMPTAFEAMKLGMGIATEVESWKFGSLGAKKEGTVLIDPKGAKAWLSPQQDFDYSLKYGWKRSSDWPAGTCIWALHGLWDPATQQAIKTDYFSSKSGEIDFSRDFWLPHFVAWAKMIRSVHSEAILFVLPEVFTVPPSFKEDRELVDLLRKRACLSTHFYDGLTLITKHWNWFNADAIGLIRGKYATLPMAIRVGSAAIRKVMRDQLGYLRQDTFDTMGNYPTMMGEIGIPYDLDKKEAYRTGNYRNQSHALDASLNGCDGTNLFNYTMWTYNPENTYRWGENWNGEDLSVWSLDDFKRNAPNTDDPAMQAASSTNLISHEESPEQEAKLNRGARAIEAFVRPYPTAMAGKPISIDFDVASSQFNLVIETRPDDLKEGFKELPTEIYLPAVHYGEVSQEDVEATEEDSEGSEPKATRGSMSRSNSFSFRKGPTLHLAHINFPWHRHKPRLALSVHVSHGHYEIVGHTLKWYHRTPATLRASGPQRETITIKRRGGPRPEVTAAFGEMPRSVAQVLWDNLCGMCSVS